MADTIILMPFLASLSSLSSPSSLYLCLLLFFRLINFGFFFSFIRLNNHLKVKKILLDSQMLLLSFLQITLMAMLSQLPIFRMLQILSLIPLGLFLHNVEFLLAKSQIELAFDLQQQWVAINWLVSSSLPYIFFNSST